MDKFEMGMKLMNCFPNSFINHLGEFIAHRETNEYFILANCENELDVKCKVLAWLSRGACKIEPYKRKQKIMLAGINKFLGTDFNINYMEIIYQYLGNGLRRPLAIKFIESGYNMSILEERTDG